MITVFYDPNNPKGSLLDRVLADKCPDYTIGHVDSSLCNIQRTFSADGQDVYSFLTGTVAEEIECLFTFDSVNRVLNAYDLKIVCDSCGYRGDMSATCPQCGSSEYHSKYGEETGVYISAENYAEQISCSGDTDNVYNCLKISGGDDNITTALMYINPNGTQYIYNFNEATLTDMPEELVEKIQQYNELYESLKAPYAEVSTTYYNAVDEKGYLEHTMMPVITTPTTDAETEAANLPQEFADFGDVAVTNITTLSQTSADLAVQGMAKVLVDARYNVKVSGSMSVLIDNTYRTWTGTATITNKGDEEDTATSNTFTVKIIGNEYEKYLYQRILKQLDRDDATFFTIFEIEDMEVFEEELTKYSKARLESFYHSYETCLNVLIENGVANENSVFYNVDLYNEMYVPYKERLTAIQNEIAVRDAQIEEQDNIITEARTAINGYHDQLDFKKYIGDNLWIIFSHYRRESTYKNENYISDGLENGEIIEKAKELFEVCEKEIQKASTEQYSLTISLNNLLNTKDFKPYKEKLAIGNWINAKIDDKLYYLRLINIGVDFGATDKITVSFSDAVRLNNTINDAQSVLSQVKSMSGSYDTVKHQASQGDKANVNVSDWLTNGLNSALVAIKNNTNEEITYDSNGLLARSYDDILDDYEPKQFKLTHNVMAFTDDNWEHVKAVVGEAQYSKYNSTTDTMTNDNIGYGVLAEFLMAPYITGAEIIAGDIYSSNYSSTNHTGSVLHLDDGTFSFAGDKLTYDGTDLNYTGNATITGGNLTVKDNSNNVLFKADVTNKSVNIGGFTVNDKAIYNGTNSTTSTTAGVYVGTDGIRNYKDSTHYVDIKNGVLTANNVNVSGTISGSTISGGTISGTNITGTTISGTDISGGSIAGTTITGGSITGSTINNGDNSFKVATNGTVTMSKANITGGTIELADSSESNPKLIVSGTNSGVQYKTYHTMGGFAVTNRNTNKYVTIFGTTAAPNENPVGNLFIADSDGNLKTNINGSGALPNSFNGNTTIYGNLSSSGEMLAQSLELTYSTPFIDFHFNNTTSDYTARIIETSAGNLVAYNNISSASDERLKKDIKDLDDKYLKLFNTLDAKQYRFKKGDEYLNLGFIAQDVDAALDKVGIKDKPLILPPSGANEYYALDYDGFIAILWNKCKDLQKQIDELKGKDND